MEAYIAGATAMQLAVFCPQGMLTQTLHLGRKAWRSKMLQPLSKRSGGKMGILCVVLLGEHQPLTHS